MFVSAFIFGLLSSLHCVGMCGPIAFALPVHNGSIKQKWIKIIAYHIGRLFTYAAIGAVFGLFGRAFVLAGLQQTLSIIAGVVLVLVAFSQKRILNYLESKTSVKIVSFIQTGYKKIRESKSVANFFSLGLLNGLLPCGTVYIALIGAITAENFIGGSLYMFVFGLGTMPLMLLLMGVKLASTTKFKLAFKRLVPVMLFVVGTLFILRGLGLGVSFVSPSDASLQVHLVPVGCH